MLPTTSRVAVLQAPVDVDRLQQAPAIFHKYSTMPLPWFGILDLNSLHPSGRRRTIGDIHDREEAITINFHY